MTRPLLGTTLRGSRRRRRTALGAALLAAAAAALPVGAQQRQQQQSSSAVAAGGGLTLDGVVRATAAGNARILAGAQQVATWEGRVLAAAAPFDPQLRTAVTSARDNVRFMLDAPTWAVQNDVTYEAGIEKTFRSGITVAPGVGVKRSATSLPSSVATSSATAGVSVRVPLMQNRGGGVYAAAERAAELDYRGTVEELRHATATSVRDAAVAYWTFAAAQRRLEVYAAAEARAVRLAEETEQLVRAEERPAGDMRQLLANVATKRAARIQAEQAVVEARYKLADAMGIPAAAAARLPAPSTAFPTPPAADAPDLTDEDVARLAAGALSRRPDLASARERTEAARVELGEFRSAAKPRLDVSVGVGYTGIESGPGVGSFFAPLYRNVPGLNASVQVSYDLPAANAAGRGRVAQGEALVAQQVIGRETIERQVASGVAVAAAGLRRSRQALHESQTAVALYGETVANEKRKFQLGMSTLFDVIASEDALTSAMLAEINGLAGYAAAIAALRWEAGLLLADAHAPRPAVNAASLLTPP